MSDRLNELIEASKLDTTILVGSDVREAAMLSRESERARIVEIVRNDAWAMTFQTLGQYRTAILREIEEEVE